MEVPNLAGIKKKSGLYSDANIKYVSVLDFQVVGRMCLAHVKQNEVDFQTTNTASKSGPVDPALWGDVPEICQVYTERPPLPLGVSADFKKSQDPQNILRLSVLGPHLVNVSR